MLKQLATPCETGRGDSCGKKSFLFASNMVKLVTWGNSYIPFLVWVDLFLLAYTRRVKFSSTLVVCIKTHFCHKLQFI